MVHILWHAERTQLHVFWLLVDTAVTIFIFEHWRVGILLLRLLVQDQAIGALGRYALLRVTHHHFCSINTILLLQLLLL